MRSLGTRAGSHACRPGLVWRIDTGHRTTTRGVNKLTPTLSLLSLSLSRAARVAADAVECLIPSDGTALIAASRAPPFKYTLAEVWSRARTDLYMVATT